MEDKDCTWTPIPSHMITPRRISKCTDRQYKMEKFIEKNFAEQRTTALLDLDPWSLSKNQIVSQKKPGDFSSKKAQNDFHETTSLPHPETTSTKNKPTTIFLG